MMKKTELEFVKCNICNGSRHKKYLKRDDGLQIVKCKNCGLHYINPRPKREFLKNIYTNKNYFIGKSTKIGYYDYLKAQKQSNFWDNKVDKIVKIYNKNGGKCLDIGCATGEFLELMKTKGFDAYGIELSPFASNIAKKKRLKVFNKNFEDVKFNSKFDIITMFDVIEHVADPAAFLLKINKILKENGLMIITTPNLKKAKLEGKEWAGFTQSQEHIYFFDIKSTKKILKKAGFEIIKIETEDPCYLPLRMDNYLKSLINKSNLNLAQRVYRKTIVKTFNFTITLLKSFNYGHLLIIYANKRPFRN